MRRRKQKKYRSSGVFVTNHVIWTHKTWPRVGFGGSDSFLPHTLASKCRILAIFGHFGIPWINLLSLLTGPISIVNSGCLPGHISHIKSCNFLWGHLPKWKTKEKKMEKREQKELEICKTWWCMISNRAIYLWNIFIHWFVLPNMKWTIDFYILLRKKTILLFAFHKSDCLVVGSNYDTWFQINNRINNGHYIPANQTDG